MPLPAEVLAKKMAKKWTQNTQGKGQVLVENLLAVIDSGVNPMKLAAAKDRKAIQRLRAVFESGTWRQIMESIPIDLYKKIVQEEAAQAYDTAVQVKGVKYQIFAQNWAPILAQHVQKIRSLPDATDADRERRMLENLRGLKKLKGAWRKIGAR